MVVLVSEPPVQPRPATVHEPPSRCPDCRTMLLERVHGHWCPRCTGFLFQSTAPPGSQGPSLTWRIYRPL